MENIKILWADDEIDLLKIQIMFLENKGYKVFTAKSGNDALEFIKKESFDIIFLDENMPGLSGLETLTKIKEILPAIPVVMITKSEEEDIMDEAIGSKIADFLIKPVNPNQILLTLKKHIDNKRLVTKKTTSAYQTEFAKLGMQINDARTFNEWCDVYKKLIFWELELEQSNDHTMDEVLKMQKSEANNAFAKYIQKNYLSWFDPKNSDKPLLSPDIFPKKVFPLLDNSKVFVILVDNLRFDQWKMIQPKLMEYFKVEKEDMFCSILPTCTQFARNAMFAGLMPMEIKKMFPELWVDDEEDESKNLFERELLQKQLTRQSKKITFAYEKIVNQKAGRKLVETINEFKDFPLSVVVYNFIDFLSHARTESEMIRELASDEAAYRSLTLSWFEHSSLTELLQYLAKQKVKIVLTTDHGSVRVNNPIKVIGDKQTTTNLRYKMGKNLSYNPKEVFAITKPQDAHLPTSNLSSSYIFSHNDDFFFFFNNYNYYVKYYKDTFQHGGISLEEMLIPCITLAPK